MGVTGELLDWLSEVGGALGLVVEFPDEDGPVPATFNNSPQIKPLKSYQTTRKGK